MTYSVLKSIVMLLVLTTLSFSADKLDVCGCKPRDEKPTDYRFAMKHIPLPVMQPQTTSVQEMLDWDQSSNPRNDAPRQGRELQLVRIPRAYVQFQSGPYGRASNALGPAI